MSKFTNWFKTSVSNHKIISAIILIAVLYAGYFAYGKMTSTTGESRYVTSKVSKGTIVVSVSGTGQVDDVNQVDLKAKASGDVVYVGAKNGDKVSAGQLILEIDPSDADKAVRDAQVNITSAELALAKLKIQNSNDNLNADLVKSYSTGFNTVASTLIDLSNITKKLNDLLNENGLSDNSARTAGNYEKGLWDQAENAYYKVNDSLSVVTKKYNSLNNNSAHEDIKGIISDTYNTTKMLSDALKIELNFVNQMATDARNPSAFTTEQNSIATYTSTINADLTSLINVQSDIKSNEDTPQSANIDIQNAELTLTQRQNALQDAKDKLADYYVRAPYAGTLANFSLQKSDSISSDATVASISTKKQLALVSLNEVDVAKIKVGQKATLTFDAIPDLSISGTVNEIDPIGTVSQGVVTYNVKINFDTQDDRVKPSMSVSAAIITDVKQDVLTVPNSAVKSQGGSSYVEMFPAPLPAPTDGLVGSISLTPPNKVTVEVGIANDSNTEIISGIKEGDEIVTRTITGAATAKAATAPSIFGASTGGARAGRVGG